ncbi:MAG: endonuclease [Bacteroidales bacterium]|jgi:hypothetical protein|nr:endonuclease [Bacteroidales bacterium]
MSQGIVTRVTCTLLLLFFSGFAGYSQDRAGGPVRMLFYNVENLFDTEDDTTTMDDEFLPRGLRRWTQTRYRAKINTLYKTIAAAGGWDAPAVIGLYETENRKVVEDLIYTTGLARYDYGIIHCDSRDERGIDVCMIYRKDLVRLIDHEYFLPADSGGVIFSTRDVLYAKIVLGKDTLNLFLNHWPSRRGGVLAGEEQRQMIARLLRSRADSIGFEDGNNAGIIFAGDFNAVPEDLTITSLSACYSSGLEMKNLSGFLPKSSGTYRYQGTWEMIDQVMISQGVSAVLEIFSPDFLLYDDPVYPGRSPFSTYRGYRYQGGYSDHLPLVLSVYPKGAF